VTWKNPSLIAGGSPAAGDFLLRRQKSPKKSAPDSDSRSVEREGAQAAARCTVNWSDIDTSSRHKFH